jgi:hypothetical protein
MASSPQIVVLTCDAHELLAVTQAVGAKGRPPVTALSISKALISLVSLREPGILLTRRDARRARGAWRA